MTPCDRVRLQLDALADGELRPWTAARVRRHLRHCPACAAEFRSIQALDSQARAWRDVTAPAGLPARIAQTLTHPSEEMPMSPEAVLPRPVRRPNAARFWPVLAPAGALAALTILGMLLLPGSPVRPTPAFADVQRAMRLVQAVSWTETQARDKDGRPILRNTHRIWVRRDPPAVAQWDSESTIPQVPGEEYAGPTRMLMDAHGIVNFHVRDGLYYLHPPLNVARQVTATIDELTASRADAYGTPERVMLDGRPVLRFHQSAPEYDLTVWVDPQTLRVVRRHTDMVAHFPTGDEHIVLDASGFQYDTPAPSGVFDLAPPPGAHVTEDDGRGNKTVVTTPESGSSAPAAPAAPTPSDGTPFVINDLYWKTSPALPTWLHPAPTTDLILTIRPVPEYHREGIASQVGHDFRLRAPGHPDIRLSLDDSTYGSHDRDHPDASRDFESFGLHLSLEERARMTPGVHYTLVPVGPPGAHPWAVAPDVRIRLP